MKCDDPDCPACRLTAILQEFKDRGLSVDDLMPILMHILGEVYDDCVFVSGEMLEVKHGTVH